MLAFSGFNGFGQFPREDRKATQFTEFPVDILAGSPLSSMRIACSWSYTAYAVNRTLMLRGFLSERPNCQLTRNTAERIEQLSACDSFCLVLLENGKLYKLCPQLDAQLVEVKFAVTPAAPAKRSIFGEPKTPTQPPFRITHVACGSNIAVAMSNTNAVYNIPSRLHQFERQFRVEQLECGFEHAVLLSGNGNVYCWGNGSRGQLGCSDSLSVEEEPVLLEALAGIKITYIAAGGWHSAAISSFGDLYTWGYNVNGQLGIRVHKPSTALPQELSSPLSEPTVYIHPQAIDIECVECDGRDSSAVDVSTAHDSCSSCHPVHVYSGARHLIVRLSCGSLLATGWNAYGQLSLSTHKDFIDTLTPMRAAMKGANNLQVICGEWCTVLICGGDNAH